MMATERIWYVLTKHIVIYSKLYRMVTKGKKRMNLLWRNGKEVPIPWLIANWRNPIFFHEVTLCLQQNAQTQ